MVVVAPPPFWPEWARFRPVLDPSSCSYPPECVEGEFPEVRPLFIRRPGSRVTRSSAAALWVGRTLVGRALTAELVVVSADGGKLVVDLLLGLP